MRERERGERVCVVGGRGERERKGRDRERERERDTYLFGIIHIVINYLIYYG